MVVNHRTGGEVTPTRNLRENEMTDIRTEDRSRTDEAKDRASDVASGAQQKAGEVAQQARDEVASVASAAGGKATELAGTARQELRDRAQSEASNVGERMRSIADELRAMGQTSQEQGGMTAGLVDQLADRMETGARRLSDGDLDTILQDVKRFARNRPGAFLLGAAGAGFLVGRILRTADLQEVKEAVTPGGQDDGSQQLSSTPSPQSLGTANPGSTPTPTTGTMPTPGTLGTPASGATPDLGSPSTPRGAF